MKNVLILLSMLMAIAAVPAAHADQYPSRPITIVVTLTAGTTVDVLARIYADAVSKRLGQPVVIANKPGAGGMIAAQSTATAAPDGYTIQMANSGHVIAGLMAKNLSFDAVADFAGIAMVGEAPAVVAITPKLNVKNLQEFVAVAKAKPGVLNYGSGGVGSATHLAGAVFLAAFGWETSQETIGAVNMAALAVLTLLTRGQVAPSSPDAPASAIRPTGV